MLIGPAYNEGDVGAVPRPADESSGEKSRLVVHAGFLPTIGRQAPTNEQNLIAATDPVLTTMAQWPLKIDLPGDRSAG